MVKFARDRLEEATDYERWSLKKLADISENHLNGPETVTTILERGPDTLIEPDGSKKMVRATGTLFGGKSGKEAVKSVWPLIFTSGYKIYDLFIEWLLEENGEKPRTKNWDFNTKIRTINGVYDKPDFELPQPLSESLEVGEYIVQLYCKLNSCRHNIIHGNEFEVGNNLILVGDRHEYQFTETRLFSWAAIPIVLVESVLRNAFDMVTERQLKYHLDRLSEIHGLGEFNLTSHRGSVVKYPLKPTEDSPIEWHPNQSWIDRSITDADEQDYYLHLIGENDGETVSQWLIPGDEWDIEREYSLTEDWRQHRAYLGSGN